MAIYNQPTNWFTDVFVPATGSVVLNRVLAYWGSGSAAIEVCYRLANPAHLFQGNMREMCSGFFTVGGVVSAMFLGAYAIDSIGEYVRQRLGQPSVDVLFSGALLGCNVALSTMAHNEQIKSFEENDSSAGYMRTIEICSNIAIPISCGVFLSKVVQKKGFDSIQNCWNNFRENIHLKFDI